MFADEANIVSNTEVALTPSASSPPGLTPSTSVSLHLQGSSASYLIPSLAPTCDPSQCCEGGVKGTQPQANS